MAYFDAVIVLVLGFQCVTVAGEYCYAHDGYTYCPNGCCGDYVNPCCNRAVSAIVGGIIGGIFLLAIIATIVCCCIRRRGARGGVLRGPQQTQMTTTCINTVQYPPGVMYPQTYPAGYPAQPMGTGPYPQQPFVYQQQLQPMAPPPYNVTAAYPSNPQGYPNAGFSPDTTQQQTDIKESPSAPPPYDAQPTAN